jgi:hypothetical protein
MSVLLKTLKTSTLSKLNKELSSALAQDVPVLKLSSSVLSRNEVLNNTHKQHQNTHIIFIFIKEKAFFFYKNVEIINYQLQRKIN